MPSTESPKRAILYARVSGEEQAKKGYSLADQLDALRDWCSKNDHEIVDEVQDGASPALTQNAPDWIGSGRWWLVGRWTRWWSSSAIASPGAFMRSLSQKSFASTEPGSSR